MLTAMLSNLFAQMSGRNGEANPAVRRRKKTHTSRHSKPGSRMYFEGLEARVLLSVDVVGVVDWIDQGAQPITQASSVAAPLNPASGAVEDLAIDPNDPSHMFAATVNGGIWRTHDGDRPFNGLDDGGIALWVDDPFEQPSWTPLTDQFPSLAINGIAFDPLDPTGNTVFAGTGSASSLSNAGGLPIGIMKTTDDGATWSVSLLNPSGSEPQVRSILPTTYDSSDDATVTQVVLVGTVGNGLYRSTDAGETYTRISNSGAGLPGGSVTEIVADPNNDAVYYAGVVGSGVYRSADGGATWSSVNNAALSTASLGTSTAVMLTAHAGGGTTRVYAMISYDDDGAGAAEVPQVFTSIDGGTTWTALAAVPANFASGFGNLYTSMASDQIVVDPADQNIVYISKGYGGSPSTLLRYDPSGAGSWDNIEVPGIGTRPHVDNRDLLFANSGGNDVLISANDGGLYFLIDPQSPPGGWVGLHGFGATGLGIIEYTNVTLDATHDVLFGGAQDNGTSVQTSPGSLVWESFRGADGGDAQSAPAPGGNSYRYAANQPGTANPNQSPITRYEFSDATTLVGSAVTLFPAAGLPGFSPRFVAQFELNRINPSRLVVGGGGTSPVYELTNADTATGTGDATWVAVPIGAGFGAVNDNDDAAFVVGGRMGGVDNEEVLIVGSGGNVFVRSTAGGTLTNTSTPFPGGTVQAIAVDPENWQHMFVADSDQVWETTDAGATWTEITRNLALINNRLQSLAYVPTAGNDVILVGGNLGVSRLTVGLPDAPWTRLGGNLPNALVSDLEYHGGADDMLIAGTFGRGAWIIEDASTVVDDIGVLQIFGDEDFFGQDDVICLVRDAANALLLNVFLNDDFYQFPLATIQQINVYGLEGDDILKVDSSYGLVNVPGGIRYDGGGGSDELQLLQTDGDIHTSDTYSVGPDIGSGVSTILGAAPAVGTADAYKQTIQFRGLEPVLDLVAAAVLTVNATPSNNAITYAEGVAAATNGLVTIDNFESIEFSNKTALVINAGAGQDTISLGNASTPTALESITVNGGDPGSGDTLILTGSGAAVTVNTATATIDGASGAAGAVDLSYSGIESLDLASEIGDLTLTTTGADDTVVVTPGLSTGNTSGTVASSGAVPAISFVNAGVLTLHLAGGDDRLTVNGSSDADTIAVSGTAVMITGRRTVNYSEVEGVTVNGQNGSDTFNVTPSGTTAFFIDGGDPVGALPGDLLNIIAGGSAVTYNIGPETDEGSFVVGAHQPVSFDHIESFGISGSGPAVINGTNGPDAITVIARDATTHAGADGVQDFTVSVNAGPELLFLDVAALTLNALSGSDQVTLQTPAPNNAVWDVDVTVNGGPPPALGADADRLIVQTPGAGAETVVYTPTAADAGTLELTTLSSVVTLTTMEQVIYDGQGDNDSVTIVGTGGDDTIVHTPGATNQAGTFAVNGLLAISYQNLGNTGSLTADGGGGNDRLVYHGTAGNDTFLINGTVRLNARLDVTTTDIEELQLEGYGGNDLFNVQSAISSSPYTTLYFNGGGQGSPAGDRVDLIGTIGDDEIAITGQTVALGGTTVVGSGIESIQLDALGGDDLLTYNGVSGVTENITVSSSGTVGGGQIIVPDVTLVNFSGVERIDVNGNAPTPTENDTLAFSGTNAADTFEINLAAAGTDLDPILTVGTPAEPLLLTLRNYTNFETLRVNGLDGTDTFNVYTADTGVSRNVQIDGGQPTGKKKSTDKLYVYYEMPRPSIIHQGNATQNPTSGLVDLEYDTSRFVVQYDDIEDVRILKV